MDIDRDTYHELPPSDSMLIQTDSLTRSSLMENRDNCAGARATRAIEDVNRLAGELALAMQVVDRLLEIIQDVTESNISTVVIDKKSTHARQLARIVAMDVPFYRVERGGGH